MPPNARDGCKDSAAEVLASSAVVVFCVFPALRNVAECMDAAVTFFFVCSPVLFLSLHGALFCRVVVPRRKMKALFGRENRRR